MEVLLDIEHDAQAVGVLPIEPLALFTMKELGLPASTEVSITFVDNDEMADLNGKFRQKEGPTDVLSFECDNLDDGFMADGLGDFDDARAPYSLGDVIIAPDVARKQATEYGNTFEEEVSLLLVHGLLHLCGHDHIEDDEAQVMEAKQTEILAAWKQARAQAPEIADGAQDAVSSDPESAYPAASAVVYHAGEERSFAVGGAFKFAFEGIIYALKTQRNMKIHLAFAIAAVLLGLVLQIDGAGWLAVVICIFVTLAFEVANTAVESITDLASSEWNVLAKHAKDCAAGAVCMCAIGSLVVAAIVYLPRIIDLIVMLVNA